MKKQWTANDIPDQSGKIFLVTGANDGLGREVTRALALKNASVVMACRNIGKAEKAKSEIASEAKNARLTIVELDLGSLESVRICAEKILAEYPRLDAIMCNAGLMAVPFGRTADGFEMQMGVNYYGHFALVGRIMPIILGSPGIRIVTTSSVAEKLGRLSLDSEWTERNYKRYSAYGDTKLAVLMFALHLNVLFEKHKIDAIALSAHPGIARSNLRTTRLATETSAWQRLQLKFYESMAFPIEMGANPLLYAAADPEARGGEYIGLSGFIEMSGYPRISRGQKKAYDLALRERLWKLSEELTGVRYSFGS